MKLQYFAPLLLCLFALRTSAVEPPTVVLRDLADAPREAQGEWIALAEHADLFLPEGEGAEAGSTATLTFHFHGASWWAAEEHLRRGARNPLVTFGGMQGSSAYRVPFEGTTLFEDLITSASAAMDRPVGPVELQSFSAGYGAIREILKTPEYVDRVEAVVLADSLYASFAVEGGGDDRAPAAHQMAPFIAFAEKAARGEKLMVVAFCEIFTPDYASTVDTARALVQAMDGRFEQVEPGSIPAADPKLANPLKFRFDQRGLHVWGYGGDDANAHMAMARTLAGYWRAVE
ncbi:MAG: hypothetical protein RLY93_03715 [Sumerlaeia bacterium]